MTSSRNAPRRKRRGARLRVVLVGLGCLAAFGAAVFGFLRLMPARTDPAAAREQVARAMQFLKVGNASAARSQAFDAVRNAPDWGEAHAVLAYAQLQLDEGVAAEGEIGRAVAAGYDAKRTHHLMAHALLLQGDTDRALAEVEKTAPQDRLYGLRIRARILTAKRNLAGAQAALQEALRVAPKDGAVWTDLGRFRFTAGDVGGAVAASAQAVQLAPGSVDALVLRGETVRAQFGLVAALPWFEAALKRDPYHHDALIEYAATLGDAGRTLDMLAATRRALEVRPGSPQAYYLQAVLAARAGNHALARGLMERTGDRLAAVPGAMLLGGTLDLEEGDTEQAIGKLRALVGTQPMNLTARKLLALAYLRSDAARNALDVMKPVVLRADADSYALALVGRAFERIEDRGMAAQFLDRAAYPARAGAVAFSADDSVAVLAQPAAANPGDPQAMVPLLRAMIDGGDAAGALAKAQVVARDNPGAPGAHLLLGDMLMLRGRPADAAVAYKAAADMRFDEPTMLRLLEALDAAGKRGEASNTLALFLSQNPRNVAALRLTAHWQLAAGEFEDAADTLEGLRARIGDGDPALNAELALAYAGTGDDDAAKQSGAAAYLLAPANPAVADAFGWALYQSGDSAGALELLQKAVAIAPRHAMLRWHLAQALADRGQGAAAKAMAQAALADPSFTDRAAATALIARLG